MGFKPAETRPAEYDGTKYEGGKLTHQFHEAGKPNTTFTMTPAEVAAAQREAEANKKSFDDARVVHTADGGTFTLDANTLGRAAAAIVRQLTK